MSLYSYVVNGLFLASFVVNVRICDALKNAYSYSSATLYKLKRTLHKNTNRFFSTSRRKVLKISNSIEEVGTINWELALSLLFVWILVFFCVRNGIKTSGKVVYFTGMQDCYFYNVY